MPSLVQRRIQVPANDVSHAFWDVFDSPNREVYPAPPQTNGDKHSTIRWETGGLYASTKKAYIRKVFRLRTGSPARFFNFHNHPADLPGGYTQRGVDNTYDTGVSAIAFDYKRGYTDSDGQGGVRLTLQPQERGSYAGSPYGNRKSWTIISQAEVDAFEAAQAWITVCMEITFGFANSTPKGAVKLWVNNETTPRINIVGVNTIWLNESMVTVWEGCYDNLAFPQDVVIDHVPYQIGIDAATCLADTPSRFTSWSATQTGTGGNGTGADIGTVDSSTLAVPPDWGGGGGGGGGATPGDMPTYVSSGVGQSVFPSTSLDVALPSGVQSGDFLLLQVDARSGANPSATPSGWTAIRNDQSDAVKQYLYYRIAQGVETGSVTIAFSASAYHQAQIHNFRGVKNSSPMEGAALTVGNNVSTLTAPSVTTTAGNRLLVLVLDSSVTDATGASNVPSIGSWTQRAVQVGLELQTLVAPTAGTNGGGAASLANVSDYVAVAFALIPNDAATGGTEPPDPTPPATYIGKVTGGSQVGVAGANGNRGSVFTAPFDGTISSVVAKVKGNGTAGQTAKLKAAIYAVGADDVPGALLKAGNEVTRDAAFASEWVTLPLASSLTLVAGQKYAIHVATEAQAVIIYYDTGAANQYHYGADTYSDGLVNPFVVADTQARAMSVYAAITPTAVGHARPTADISSGGWTPSTGSTLAGTLDETSASDADFISSPLSPIAFARSEVKLGAIADPLSSTGHIVRYRYKKSASGGDWINLTVRLLQGARVIASWQHVNISSTITAAAQTLTSDQADSITSYSDLRLAFEMETVDTTNEINVLTDYGTTDAQVRAAIAASESQNKNLYFPAGTYNFNTTMITNNAKRWRGDGPTSIIQAGTPANSAIRMQGNGPVLRDLKIQCPTYSTRLTNNESHGVFVNGATNFLIKNVVTDKNGFFNYGGSNGKILDNTVNNCFTDGIHNTHVAHDIEVAYNRVFNSGDDHISVVSYIADGARCYNVNVHDNNTSVQSTAGRGLTVLGGTNVQFLRNSVSKTKASCLHASSEPPESWNTYGVDGCVFQDNVCRQPDLSNIHLCNLRIWAGNASQPINNVSGTGNIGDTSLGDALIISDGPGAKTNITVSMVAG